MMEAIELDPRKSPTQRRSKATFDALVEATARVLMEEGYTEATTNRIAEVAGVSIGSLYQYFPNKDALVFAVAQQHAGQMIGLLIQAVASASAPIPDAIRAVVRAMIAAHAVDPELHRALVEQVLHLGLDRYLDIQKRARELIRLWLDLRRAEMDVENPDMTAWMLVNAVESAVHAALLEDPALLRDPAFEDELVRMLARYVQPRG